MAHRNRLRLSRDEAREVDRQASDRLQIPSVCLMENAGAGAARFLLRRVSRRDRVVCLAGPGGNGGDAMVVARHLAIDGVDVEIVLLAAGPVPLQRDAALQAAICRAMALPIRHVDHAGAPRSVVASLRRAAILVDGLYGTGLTRPIAGVAQALVRAINASRRPVLALDIPSGLDCDSGEPLGPCVRAETTATFGAPKLGFANPASRVFTGTVRVVPIGAPVVWPRPST